jgi:hypothetical protein
MVSVTVCSKIECEWKDIQDLMYGRGSEGNEVWEMQGWTDIQHLIVRVSDGRQRLFI